MDHFTLGREGAMPTSITPHTVSTRRFRVAFGGSVPAHGADAFTDRNIAHSAHRSLDDDARAVSLPSRGLPGDSTRYPAPNLCSVTDAGSSGPPAAPSMPSPMSLPRSASGKVVSIGTDKSICALSNEVSFSLREQQGHLSAVEATTTSLPLQLADRQYGGAIVRISELQRQSGSETYAYGLGLTRGRETARKASAHVQSGRSVSDSCLQPLPEEAYSAARVVTSSHTQRGAGATRNVAQRKCTTKNGGRGGKKSAASKVALQLQPNGEPYEFRWYTSRGQRRLVYNGRTYKGTQAHRMWNELKRHGQESLRRVVSVAPPSTSTPLQKTSPRDHPLNLSATAGSTVRAAKATSTPSSSGARHRASDWSYLTNDLNLEEDDLPPKCMHNSSTTRHSKRQAHPSEVSTVASPSRISALHLLAACRPVADVPTPFTACNEEVRERVPHVVDIDADDDHDTVPAPHSSGVVSWPVSYFNSDEDTTESSQASECAKETGKRYAESDSDMVLSSLPSMKCMKLGNHVVVEQDGWVYSADAFASLSQPSASCNPARTTEVATARLAMPPQQPAPKRRKCECNVPFSVATSVSVHDATSDQVEDTPLSELFWKASGCGSAAKEARGLEVVGCPSCPSSNVPGGCSDYLSLRQVAPTVGPLFGRYEMHGDLEGLRVEDVEGMFDAGEEVGGIRFEG